MILAFEELYAFACSRLPKRLRRLKVPSEDVADIVHDVVLIAHRRLGRFQPRRLGAGEVDVDRVLLAWLVAITWRYVSARRARASSRLELCVGDVANLGAAGDGSLTPEELAGHGQRRALVLHVLRRLRPERAEVLVLHDVGEMPVPEIAGRLRLNENTAKSRLLRARRDARAVVQRMSRPSAPALWAELAGAE